MKKVLSFVLVLAMVLGSVAMAFAVDYSDVTADSDYSEAIGTLSELGVLNGYEDGTFKAERTIKRSEFAKVVIEALGLKPTAATATQFSDVPADKWYAPYVALAAQLAIVNGFGDGTFRPDQTITDTQAIVMVVRALGYTDDYFGGYNAAKYISQATYLGLMEDVNAGTGASTRGNVAQLVYNALEVPRVVVDKDGNATRVNTASAGPAVYDTMMKRLSGEPVNGGNPFVFGLAANGYKAAAGKNLTAYTGKFVTAVGDEANKLVSGISAVLSTTLAGKWDGTSKFMVGDAAYTFYPTADAIANVPCFVNGAESGLANVNGTTGAVSLEAKVNGSVVTTLYSISMWVPTATFTYEKDMLDEAARDLNGHKFTPDSVGKIKADSFELLGVASLADIKVGNVVTVYEANNEITRIEVGTKTVTGQVTEITSAPKYVIGGTSYTLSALEGAAAPALGDKGTFCFDYAGNLYGVEVEEAAAATVYYGVKLEMVDGSTGINSATAKAQLFTADGSKVILSGDKTAAPNGIWTPAGMNNKTEQYVSYTLNADGQIHSIEAFTTGKTSAAAAPVAKDGTITLSDTKNYKLTANSKLLVKKGAKDYAAGKAADLFGANVTLAAVAVKGTEILFAVVDGTSAGTAAGTYVVFNGYTEKYASSGNYIEINVLEAGAAKAYKSNGTPVATTTAIASTGAGLVNLTVDTNGFITAAPAATAYTPATVAYTTKTAISNNMIQVDGTDGGIAINPNIVVYVFKSNAWTVGSVSDLVKSKGGATIKLYETDTNVNGADVALVY
jgi:hypothetical protein